MMRKLQPLTFLSFYGHVTEVLVLCDVQYSYHIMYIGLIHAIEMVLHIQYKYSIQYTNWRDFWTFVAPRALWLHRPNLITLDEPIM